MRTIAYWLSLLVLFMIPFEKLITFGAHDAPTLVKYVGLLVAAFWLVTVFVTDRVRRLRPFHLVAIAFVVWNIASIWWSVDAWRSIGRVTSYVQLLGLVLLIWDLYTAPKALPAALQAYVLGAYVSAIGTIANYLSGVTAHENIVRYSARNFNENEVSLVMALGVPIAWYLATSRNKGAHRKLLSVVNYLYLPVGLLAILLTASRGGVISLSPALFFVLASFARLRFLSRILIFLVMVGALLVVHSFVPDSSYERLAEADEQLTEGDLTGRVEIWKEAVEIFLERPLLGVGAGAFQSANERERAAHNIYLSILADVGLPGFLLFFSLLAIAVLNALRRPGWESQLWLTLLLIWAIGNSALSLEYSKVTWLMLSLPVISANAGWRPTIARDLKAWRLAAVGS